MQTAQDWTTAWAPNRSLVPPDLVIHCGDNVHLAQPADGPVAIGREPSVRIVIDDPRVSRTHVLVEPAYGGWTVTDTGSTNGMFADGLRRTAVAITDGATIHLGNPAGIPVTFGFADPEIPLPRNQSGGTPVPTDPGVVRAGAAVAARRRELGYSQRRLDDDQIVSERVLSGFEHGQIWPAGTTRAKMEGYLRWPVGTIAAIRHGARPPEDDTAEIAYGPAQAAMIADAAALELAAIRARIDTVPSIADPAFGVHIAALLADLRALQSAVANTVHTVQGAPQVAVILSEVRHSYHDVIERAARAPKATLGQRLCALRLRTELSADEVADVAKVAVDDVTAAEADHMLAPKTASALEAFIAALTTDRESKPW
jgi:pSer/pThr/pTyr-binding forkhead associated (FHA) protein